MKKANIKINKDEYVILEIDEENKSAKLGKFNFKNYEDFIYFINQLTDIAEELEVE